MSKRATCVLAIIGTGTAVGKTYVATRLIGALREKGLCVSARKPLQSGTEPRGRDDASLLAMATSEDDNTVCPSDRRFALDIAPPMAAAQLGVPIPSTIELVEKLHFDDATDLGVVELAGGLRSPFSSDGDGLDYLHALQPEAVVLVAQSGLGALNAVRLCTGYLDDRTIVYLNQFDPSDELHEHNRAWLVKEGFAVHADVPGLADAVLIGMELIK
jgi:dethiobiotin synthetase